MLTIAKASGLVVIRPVSDQLVNDTRSETIDFEPIRAGSFNEELDHFDEDMDAAELVPTAKDDEDLTYGEEEIIATAARAT